MENKAKKKVNKKGKCILNNNDIIYKCEYKGIYYENSINENLINNTIIKNCNCNTVMYLYYPNIPLKEDLCIECNKYYDEIESDNYSESYKKCYKDPLGYYLDKNIYKKCFNTCKKFEINGNNITYNSLKYSCVFYIFVESN